MSMIGPQFAAAAAVRFSAKNFDSSNRILSQSAAFFVTPNKHRRSGGRMKSRDGIRAAATKEQSSSGAVKQNAERQRYHPFEEIAELELLENGEPRLRPAATTRIIIEECALTGVDSIGFDLRVCSGTQASSEYSAERKLNDLLFSRAHRFQQKKEAQQAES